MKDPVKKVLPVCASLLLAWIASPVLAAEEQEADSRDVQQLIHDAWVRGKLEAAYTFNRHLNPFDIKTDVQQGVVTLSGIVDSDIERDLAGEIAKGIEGIDEVRNDLEVDSALARTVDDEDADERRSFGRWVDDATTTAAVKMNLARNRNVAARDISVETHNDVVTLTGSVRSDQEKQLAEYIASNTSDVREVLSELMVRDE